MNNAKVDELRKVLETKIQNTRSELVDLFKQSINEIHSESELAKLHERVSQIETHVSELLVLQEIFEIHDRSWDEVDKFWSCRGCGYELIPENGEFEPQYCPTRQALAKLIGEK